MKIPIYQVDAFTGRLFGGNPAAVCPLESWLPDETMQAVAAENNLSETAFFVRKGGVFEIRWFTPKIEIALAGHPTLAAAHVIFEHLGYAAPRITFLSESGEIGVVKEGGVLWMDFPAFEAAPAGDAVEQVVRGLRASPGKFSRDGTISSSSTARKISFPSVPTSGNSKSSTAWASSPPPGGMPPISSPDSSPRARRDSRGPGHGFGPHPAHPLLGQAAWKKHAACLPGLGATRRNLLRTPGSARPDRRAGCDLHDGHDRGLKPPWM